MSARLPIASLTHYRSASFQSATCMNDGPDVTGGFGKPKLSPRICSPLPSNVVWVGSLEPDPLPRWSIQYIEIWTAFHAQLSS